VKKSYPGNGAKSNRHRILLVDDDPDVVEVLRRGLKVKGLQVDAYTFPQEALQSFKRGSYDLAILDIRMPAMTGFQLYREMKKVDAAIAICFLSAFEIQPEEFKSVFPSMDSVKIVIKKPISINGLLKQITPFLRVSERAREDPG
jgi:two-component system, OmpR family, alkaline phosphatase synthesis response regulator PhoP